MSTTTTARHTVSRGTDGWEVIDNSTGDVVATEASRARAREVKDRLNDEAQAAAEDADRPENDPEHQVFLAMTPAEQSTELVRLAREAQDDYVGPDGLGDPEPEQPEDTPAPESDPCGYCEGKGMETTSGDPSPMPCPNCGAVNADAKVKAPKPAGTGQSEFARKLQPGQRIVLRGVGTVTVSSVSKVKGVQKVLVVFITEADEQDQRELWVNSKYRLVV